MYRHISLLPRKFSQKKSRQKRLVMAHCALHTHERHDSPVTIKLPTIPDALKPRLFDPELLYVECGRCGAPVLWEHGRATLLLQEAGIDPMELDSSCLLVTDACPMCSSKKKQYIVQIFRVSSNAESIMYLTGNA